MSHARRHVAVLVSSRWPDTPYDRWVEGADIDLTLLASSHVADGYSHVGAPHGVLSFGSYRHNGNVERAVIELNRQRPLDALVARAEPDIMRAGRLRDMLGLPGQDWESSLAFRDKVEMKRRVSLAGITVPEHVQLECAADLCAFVDRHGYPVVVKPVRGSGSLGTAVIACEADLVERLCQGVDDSWMVERFVGGQMFTVDGLVVDGTARVLAPARYVNDCLSHQRGEFLGHILLPGDSELSTRLAGFARLVLAAMPLPPAMAFHLEVWLTPTGELVFCEVASRTGGIRIAEALKHAVGFDLDREWFAAQVGLAPSEPERPLNPETPGTGNLVLYPADGVLAALPEDAGPEGIVSRHLAGAPGDRFHGGHKSGDYLAGFVVTADSHSQVEQRFHEVASWFTAGCRWEPAC